MPKSGRPLQPSKRLTTDLAVRRDASERIDAACRSVVAGKLALRDITAWVNRFGVSDTEFRLLWLLFQLEGPTTSCAIDQAELAEQLAVSAAQVSAVVERLMQRELVVRILDGADRRRQLWRLAGAGEQLVRNIIASIAAFEASSRTREDAA
jgi:DNA-binding MarR family transcriptional regulator